MSHYTNMASCLLVFVSHFTVDAAPVSFETNPPLPPRGTNLVDDVSLKGYIEYRIRDCIRLLSIRHEILKRKHGRVIVSLLCDVVFKILAVFVVDCFVLFCFSDFSV